MPFALAKKNRVTATIECERDNELTGVYVHSSKLLVIFRSWILSPIYTSQRMRIVLILELRVMVSKQKKLFSDTRVLVPISEPVPISVTFKIFHL